MKNRYSKMKAWGLAAGAGALCAFVTPAFAVPVIPGASGFGIDTAQLKLVVFVYAALLAALSGWLYAHFLRFVSPGAFAVHIGIEYLFMAVVGGASQVWGALVGASLLTLLKEWLKDILPKFFAQSGNYEVIVFGLLMLPLLHRARDGLMPWK